MDFVEECCCKKGQTQNDVVTMKLFFQIEKLTRKMMHETNQFFPKRGTSTKIHIKQLFITNIFTFPHKNRTNSIIITININKKNCKLKLKVFVIRVDFTECTVCVCVSFWT